jgi:hypothetical protein
VEEVCARFTRAPAQYAGIHEDAGAKAGEGSLEDCLAVETQQAYTKFAQLLGVDLHDDPDLACSRTSPSSSSPRGWPTASSGNH